jgi:hypothetical protein
LRLRIVVRRLVTHRLSLFPDESVLEGLTGHHRLKWVNGRISASTCSDPQRHPNLARGRSLDGWDARSFFPDREADDAKDRDAATDEHYVAVRTALSDLKAMGYYSKLPDVLPPMGRPALAEFALYSRWYWGLEGWASKGLSAHLELAAGTDNFEIKYLWKDARTTKELNRARRSAEAAVREAIHTARDDLWDGYLQSARVAALLKAISHGQRERLIDRLKQ